MRAAHSVEQVRAAERKLMAELPEGTLMQRAAAGLAIAVADFLGVVYGARVLLLVGSGDNGGDTLYAGARLAKRGAAVEAILLFGRVHTAALAEFNRCGGRAVHLDEAHPPDVLVDGIVGIGGRPGLRPQAARALRRFAGVPVVAVDTPTGVEVDSGRLDGPHVTADLTVTFGTHKICHLVDPAASACGAVSLIDIGLDLPEPKLTALQADDVASLVPQPVGSDHKYTRGVVGVRAGSVAFPGAAVLCTSGASCGLAGMVRYVGVAADPVQARHPGVVVGAGRVQAWVVGPGTDSDAGRTLEEAQEDELPMVIDADALLQLHGPAGPNAVLTPHAGELASMLGVDREKVEDAPLRYALHAAKRYQAVVLLKGRHSLIVHPDGSVRVTTTGLPWLAIAGAGDVLAGVIGALLAAGLGPFDAASVGSWLHGAAATYAGRGGPLTPERVADALPDVVRELLA